MVVGVIVVSLTGKVGHDRNIGLPGPQVRWLSRYLDVSLSPSDGSPPPLKEPHE